MKYSLLDLIDMEQFQNLQDRLNEIYSFPSAIIDNDGKILTATAWQDICTQFHRKNPDCERECRLSDQYILSHIHEANPAVSYRCPHGLMDNATPIVIDGIHYGNFFTGQFFLEKPDMDFFRAQAQKYGFEEDAYLKAVEKVPIWSKEHLNSYLFFIKGLIAVISESGLKKLKETEARKQIEDSEERSDTILQTAMDAFWLVDTQGRLLEVNEAYCQMSGYAREELLQMSIVELEANESSDEIAAHIDQVKQAGSARFERQQRRKDGRIIDVELSVTYMPASGGRFFCFLRDITECKYFDEILRKERALFRTIIDNIPYPIYAKDAQARKVLANFADLRIIGASSEAEVLGKDDFELFPKAHAEKYNAVDQSVLQSGKPIVDVEDAFTDQSGKTLWLLSSKIPIFDDKGKVAGLVGITKEITERKRAEEALRESRDMIVKITDQVPGVVYQYRLYPDGRSCFPFASSGMNDIYEVTPEEVREDAAPVFGRLHPDDHDRIASSIHESARTIEPFHCEFRVVLPRQGLRWRLCDALPERMDDGGTLWHGIISDITDRRLTEEALRESEARLNEAQSIAHLGSWECDPLTNMLFWSDETYRIFEIGRRSAFASYDAFIEAIHPEDRDAVKAAYAHSLKTRIPYEITHRLLLPDGRIKFVLEKCETHYSPEGVPIRSVGIVQDITERKRAEAEKAKLEAQFQQSQKMESVGLLAGGVAHDFNNLLAVIMMQLGFLQRNPNQDPSTQESLAGLMEEVKRASNLPRQLLMFSRKSILDVKVLDLNEVIANLLKMLSRLIGEHITVQFEQNGGLPPVEADAGMMEQVVMNLALNARDAMPKGGRLTIRIGPVQIDTQRVKDKIGVEPGTFVCMTVADTGCGMDDATLKRIFEPFFTTKEVGKGTGLGLATVDGIVAQHKGWVDVESELGKGTTFKVFIPATTQGMAVPTTTEKMPVIRGHETILLVEDEAILRRLVAQGLRSLGYRVLEADNGQTAMKSWQEHGQQIDLLFSDMMMPEGLTGLDLAEKLRLEKPNLKVIISSGYNVETAGHGKQAAGGIVYFQKPYEFEMLSKTIRDCLDRV